MVDLRYLEGLLGGELGSFLLSCFPFSFVVVSYICFASFASCCGSDLEVVVLGASGSSEAEENGDLQEG